MRRQERVDLGMAELELLAAVEKFNHAAEHLAAAGHLVASSDASRAAGRCSDIAAEVALKLAADVHTHEGIAA